MASTPLHIKHKLDENLSPTDQTIYVRAPGRINLIGEHTDYNKGLVLPGAIDKYFYMSAHPNNSDNIRATALDLNESITLDIHNLKKSKYLWANFLIGILIEFQKIGVELKGMDCVFASEVPIGAGMSSSSAIECGFLVGLQSIFSTELDRWQLINMSQTSNHNFLGIKGGILDQFSSLFGKKEKVMFLDCDSRGHTYIELPPSDYKWLLINSCVKHNHLLSGYNDRVQECQLGLLQLKKIFPNIEHLSQLTETHVLDRVNFSSQEIEDRVRYIIEENIRVKAFVTAIKNRDYKACGDLLYASHKGLSVDYNVSCPELDYLVEILRDNSDVLGSRMMGGGFGGCTLNLIHRDAIDDVKELVSSNYQKAFGISPEFYPVNISEGASLLEG